MCTGHEKRDIPADDARCRRGPAALQCNPAVAGLAVLVALAVMSAAGIRAHEAGVLQALRGAAAGALTLAVLAGLRAMARWVSAQDAPRPETDHAIPLPPDATAVTPGRADADRAAMAADADALRDGQLDMVFTACGNLFELDDSKAGEDAI